MNASPVQQNNCGQNTASPTLSIFIAASARVREVGRDMTGIPWEPVRKVSAPQNTALLARACSFSTGMAQIKVPPHAQWA